ncbi:DUF2946 family protein [Muricoccus aerilatus]|uniref:DUF2946 family protein n=1 Tax=Muricoccus aerilatus TaxID=452982 RepID=UPI00316AE4A8
MRRHPRGLVRLLACLLLLQWAGAVLPHARAMAQLASAQLVELCTHEGTRQTLVGDDGQPIKASQAVDCCTLCFGPAALPVAEPYAVPLPVAYVLVAEHFGREGLPSSPPRAPPQQPRAPPST